jgi:hypothetical protein
MTTGIIRQAKDRPRLILRQALFFIGPAGTSALLLGATVVTRSSPCRAVPLSLEESEAMPKY